VLQQAQEATGVMVLQQQLEGSVGVRDAAPACRQQHWGLGTVKLQ
jgi:hypothetical protein